MEVFYGAKNRTVLVSFAVRNARASFFAFHWSSSQEVGSSNRDIELWDTYISTLHHHFLGSVHEFFFGSSNTGREKIGVKRFFAFCFVHAHFQRKRSVPLYLRPNTFIGFSSSQNSLRSEPKNREHLSLPLTSNCRWWTVAMLRGTGVSLKQPRPRRQYRVCSDQDCKSVFAVCV